MKKLLGNYSKKDLWIKSNNKSNCKKIIKKQCMKVTQSTEKFALSNINCNSIQIYLMG